MWLSVTLGVDMNDGQGVGTQCFGRRLALLVSFNLVTGFFEGLNQQGAVFRIVGLAVGGLAERFRGGGEVVCAEG